MVNFKYFGLPLLLGLFSGVSASCSITISEGSCVASDCKTGDEGFYYANGKLIYYDGSNCNIETNPVPGFYMDLNDATKYIECKVGSCTSTDLPSSTSTCDDKSEGKLIKIDNDNYGVCTKINKLDDDFDEVLKNNYVTISFTDSANSRYLIHHKTGTPFDFSSSADTVYYVVKTTSNYINFDLEIDSERTVIDICATSDTGILMDRKTDFCSSTSSGMYYSCTNGKCTGESQLDSTKESNGKKVCTCNDSVGSDCTESDDYGFYLTGTDLYEYSASSSCTIVTGTAVVGYYWNGNKYDDVTQYVDSSYGKATIAVTSSCANNQGEIIDTGYNLAICKSATEAIPISSIDDNTEFFIAGKSDAPIFKNNYNAVKKVKNSLVLNAIFGNYLDDEGNLFVCTNGNCEKKDNPAGYYLNSANTAANKLIKCDTEGCAVEASVPINGYYLNKDSSNKAIICNDSECKEESIESSDCSSKLSKLAYVSSNLKFCKDDTGEAIPNDNTIKYYIVSNVIDTGINYPDTFGTGTGKMIIAVSQYSVVRYINTTGGVCIKDGAIADCVADDDMYICSDKAKACTQTKYTICIPTDSDSSKRASCSGYYLSGNSLLHCSPTDDDIIECPNKNISGYFVNSDLTTGAKPYIKCICTGVDCTCIGLNQPDSSVNDCSSKNSGDLIYGGISNPVKLCLTTNKSIDIFKENDTSMEFIDSNILDEKTGKYYMLSLGVSSVEKKQIAKDALYFYDSKVMKCVQASNDCTTITAEGLYVNDAPKDDEKLKLIECNGNSCSLSATNKSSGYYVNTGDASKLIVCGANECTSKDVETKGYYVNSENAATLINCDDTCTSETTATGAGVYLNAADKNKLITCDGSTSCTAATIDITSGYFVNGAATDANKKKLIKCGSDECKLEDNDSTEGYYQYIPADGSSVSGKIIIHCDGTTCATKTAENVNEGSYIVAVDNKKLINCGSTCSLVDSPGVGYYINALESKKLIKCVDGTGCSISEDYTQGYYVNKANSKLIVCEGEGAQKECKAINDPTSGSIYLDAADSSKVISCSTDCTEIYLEGYSLNAANTITPAQKLIECINNECHEMDVDTNGYYFNSGSTSSVVICNDSGCTKADAATRCGSHKLVFFTPNLKYCIDDTDTNAVLLPEAITSKKYYIVDNVGDTGINYPNTFGTGTGKMIIEVSKYSVVKYKSNVGICITASNTKEDPCQVGEEKMFTCSDKDKQCTVTDVLACVPDSEETNTAARGSCSGYYLTGTSLRLCSPNNEGKIYCPIQQKHGYFINAANQKYIKCTKNRTTYSCTEMDKLTATVCTNNEGKLISGTGNAVLLCTDGDVSNAIKVFKADTSKYFMKASYITSNIDGNKYYIISLDEKTVQPIELDSSTDRHFRYTFASPKILMDDTPSQCEVTSGFTTSGFTYTDLKEYEITDDDDNTYKLIG